MAIIKIIAYGNADTLTAGFPMYINTDQVSRIQHDTHNLRDAIVLKNESGDTLVAIDMANTNGASDFRPYSKTISEKIDNLREVPFVQDIELPLTESGAKVVFVR